MCKKIKKWGNCSTCVELTWKNGPFYTTAKCNSLKLYRLKMSSINPQTVKLSAFNGYNELISVVL
ncbi:hypothetical protein GCM10027185_36730 [Spirosoma pulveris]